MKHFSLLAILSFALAVVNAQQKREGNAKDLKKFQDSLKQHHLQLDGHKNSKGLISIGPSQKPVLIYKTDKGSVYASQLDKMRILVPEYHSKMPVAKDSPRIFMPNAAPLENNLGSGIIVLPPSSGKKK